MRLIRRLFKTDIKRLVKENYKVVVLGSREAVPEDIIRFIDEAEEKSKHGTRATLAVCFNYGGQEEIVRAARRLIEQKKSSDDITLESFAAALDHPELPPCDVIVRTSGELRLSDFMLWRAAYSEFIFLEKFWPEMTKQDVTDILQTYTQRKRRFGG
jgi:undecaprenyl diphosphate synthase